MRLKEFVIAKQQEDRIVKTSLGYLVSTISETKKHGDKVHFNQNVKYIFTNNYLFYDK